VHAATHSMPGVVLSDFQSVFVVTPIIVPITAAILLFTRRRAGLWLLLVSYGLISTRTIDHM